MRTKEEIEEVMNDSISVGECFHDEVETEEDKEFFHRTNSKVKQIIENERSITAASMRLLGEVLSVDFTPEQWYAMTIIAIDWFEVGKRAGADRTLEFLSEMRGLQRE